MHALFVSILLPEALQGIRGRKGGYGLSGYMPGIRVVGGNRSSARKKTRRNAMRTKRTKKPGEGQKDSGETAVSGNPGRKISAQAGVYRSSQPIKLRGRFPDGWQAEEAIHQKFGIHNAEASFSGKYPAGREKQENRSAGSLNKKKNARYIGREGHLRQDAYIANTAYTGYGSQACETELFGYSLEDPDEYSRTCCGKCRHHLRLWGERIWICDNCESEKCGFPTDYGDSCGSYERDER